MSYILNKTNGVVVATVQDASIDRTTDLIFVGRNYAGYGEYQNENFLKLLENFSNAIPPSKPVEGQLWFDNINKKFSGYNGLYWKGLANLEIKNSDPFGTKTFLPGDLWYNSSSAQLFVYNGTNFSLIGPLAGDDTKSAWRGSREYSTVEGLQTPKFNVKAVIGVRNDVVAVVSAESYDILQGSESFPVFGLQNVIKKGITLIGSSNTGTSEASGNFFWGSASHALRANTSTSARGLLSISNTSDDQEYNIPFLSTSTATSYSLNYVDPGFSYNPYLKTVKTAFFDGIATSAYYADLAERYAADEIYDIGTVVILGGPAEITASTQRADTAVAGVISKYPAFKMNSAAGTDESHPYVALRGRVPCKVTGKVRKGQLLVSSTKPGFAEAYRDNDNPHAVIGKAIQDFDSDDGMIEILI